MPYPGPNGGDGSLRHRQSVGGLPRPLSASVASVSEVRNSGRTGSTRNKAMPPVPRASVVLSASRRSPIVYAALLSRVAEAFRDHITLAERVKDGLAYKDAFDGRDAVTKIAEIIKTTDRNLALLLGRALDAQKFFHDVTYDHRLRDSANELFQFRTALPSPFMNADEAGAQNTHHSNGGNTEGNGEAQNGFGRPFISPLSTRGQEKSLSSSTANSEQTHASSSLLSPASAMTGSSGSPLPNDSGSVVDIEGNAEAGTALHRSDSVGYDDVDEVLLPSGVFTLLTDCYSPTCTRDRLCYSIACPRRLEQQARLNLQPQPGLKRSLSRESLGDLVVRNYKILTSQGLFTNRFLHGSRNLGRCGYIACRKK